MIHSVRTEQNKTSKYLVSAANQGRKKLMKTGKKDEEVEEHFYRD